MGGTKETMKEGKVERINSFYTKNDIQNHNLILHPPKKKIKYY